MKKRAKVERGNFEKALYGGKGDKPSKQQDAKMVKTKKATYYVSDDALGILEDERYARKKAGDPATYSQLVDEAIRTAFGKNGNFDEAADAFIEGMEQDKKRRR